MSFRLLAIAVVSLALAAFPALASAAGTSVGTIDVTFNGQGTSATYSGTRGLSHYIVTDCAGNVTKVELTGDNKTYTITDLDGIASLFVKAGTGTATYYGYCGTSSGTSYSYS